MSKVKKQWSVDRNFNLTLNKKETLDKFLSIYSKLNDDESNLEVIINALMREGLAKRPEALKQSILTMYRSHGLINETKLTEVALIYMNDVITFEELLMLQHFKKQFKRNEEALVRPLVVSVLVLIELEKHSSEFAYIDAYDYFNHLIRINDYNQVKKVAEDMIHDKKFDVNRTVEKIADFDIWVNTFDALPIFVKSEKYSFRLDPQRTDLIELIASNHELSQVCKPNEDWREYYGNIKYGFLEILPPINLLPKKNTQLLKEFHSKILKTFFFSNYKSYDEIESHVFAATDMDTIQPNGQYVKYIVNSYGIDDKYMGTFWPLRTYLNLVRLSPKYAHLKDIFSLIFDENLEGEIKQSEHKGFNKIIFGSPGTGKSYLVKENYQIEGAYERVTFHPEYSFNDFVGGIKPIINSDGAIKYEFEPGPFATILKKAILNEHLSYNLIIEELNRANAPAVFGDLFQLLDRNEYGSSEYAITNFDLGEYIYANKERKVSIPSNLSIIATMNSADQNVFVLDTAFKRRWDIEFLPIDFSKCSYAEVEIPQFNLTWEQFVVTINKYLLELANEGIFIPEDKLIGPWFISESNLYQSNLFASKVLGYIWDDVLKNDKEYLFNTSLISSYVDLITTFKKHGRIIFSDRFLKKLDLLNVVETAPIDVNKEVHFVEQENQLQIVAEKNKTLEGQGFDY